MDGEYFDGKYLAALMQNLDDIDCLLGVAGASAIYRSNFFTIHQ